MQKLRLWYFTFIFSFFQIEVDGRAKRGIMIQEHLRGLHSVRLSCADFFAPNSSLMRTLYEVVGIMRVELAAHITHAKSYGSY